jgi:hypothetical protein
MGQRAPEVVDEVRLSRPADVVEDGARLARKFIVGKQLYRRHGQSRGLVCDVPQS